jgi:glutathione S-transferase
MTITVYDLCGANDLRFSPNCWRTRLALAHKGLEAAFEPWHFTEKERIAFSGGKTVPVLVDGEQTVRDSWEIATYLEDAYPEKPSLFGGDAGRAVTGFINAWCDSHLHPGVIRCVLPEIYDRLDEIDRPYFKESQERRFGVPLDDFRAKKADHVAALGQTLTPLRTILKAEDWIAGDAPAYADYLVFAAFQWARLVSPEDLLHADDPIHPWRERMLDLFDGLARGFDAAT